MDRQIVFICMWLLPLLSQAQTWSEAYPIEGASVSGQSIHVLDESLIVESYVLLNDRQQLHLLSIDLASGEIFESAEIGDAGEIYYPGGAQNVLVDNDSIFVVATVQSETGYRNELKVFNANLDELSTLSIERDTLTGWNSLTRIDSRIFIAGFATNQGTQVDEILLEEVDLTLGIVQSHTFGLEELGNPGFEFSAFRIEANTSNELIVSGQKRNPSAFDDCTYLSFDTGRMIIILNEDGSLQDAYDGDDNCEFDFKVSASTSQTGLLYVGSTLDFESDCGDTYDCYRASITQLDQDLTEEWNVLLGTPSIDANHTGITVGSDFVIVGGYELAFDGVRYQTLLSKLDLNGEVAWSHSFRHTPNQPTGINNLVVLQDSRIAVTGFIEESPINPSKQIWVALLDEFGCLDADCWTDISELGQYQNKRLQVYPNPSTSEVNLSIELAQQSSGQFRLISTLGEEVWTSDQVLLQPGMNQPTMNLPPSIKGTYILSWMDEHGRSESIPVIIQ